jgi:hypothetical protein
MPSGRTAERITPERKLLRMKPLRSLPQRRVAPVAAVVVALSAGGMGIAQGSSHPPSDRAKAAKGKKRHTLDVAYKTSQIDIVGEGEGSSDAELSDDAKLQGRPFGVYKAHLDEDRFFTYTVPNQIPRSDYSGSESVSFKAAVFADPKFRGRTTGTFRGLYTYSLDSDGNILSPITGVITSGTGTFKGAGGRFDVLGLVRTSHDPERQAGRWRGFIRY